MNTNRTDRKIALRILAEVTPGRSFAEAVRSAAWKGLVEARDLGWTEAECAALVQGFAEVGADLAATIPADVFAA